MKLISIYRFVPYTYKYLHIFNDFFLFSIQSCIKVALDFVSPENVGECIRLTDEFHTLPQNHRAKEDKLEVCN